MTARRTVDAAVPFTGTVGKEYVIEQLSLEIRSGALSPGHRLVEAELSERYNVTRNAARLALDVLTVEGLVERVANKGARVRRVSLDEAVAIMECRMVLDGLIARKAAERASSKDRAELKKHLQAMRRELDQANLLAYSDLIQEYHGIVQRIAAHPTATALIDRLQGQIVRQQFQLSLRPSRANKSIHEITAVVSAIAEKAPGKAEEAARIHLLGVIAALQEEAQG